MDRSSATPGTTFLAQYTSPEIELKAVDLRFELGGEMTRVIATMDVVRVDRESTAPIVLFGDELVLESVSVDGEPLVKSGYAVRDDDLHLLDVPGEFRLQVCNTIAPAENTALMGLYESASSLCTQCEAEGFRRITFFPDRPDVLTIFTTTLVGDRDQYPELLSNGNLIDSGELADNRHYATWHDPWPKPSYLFALVAGRLAFIEDSFTTVSGRDVCLRLYVEDHNKDKCEHAMAALIKSMDWDEQVYGREYDLDIYNIVAVDDFNMGAMENKSLNVFNSKYVLASPATATDADYQNIESVIAHEYFHNWSGNRVTCRDWFQLSLKEGFTVFRDQQFSADTFSAGVKRIEDVNLLRTHQFREDAGPMAHPVRPESYVEINNFYTATVYNKGAEVVRMLHTLLGVDKFRRGTDLYFERHDGQAVTIEDFIASLEEANDCDFSQFRRWYSQAGTPSLRVRRRYDDARRTLTLAIEQSCADTPGQSGKEPFHLPVAVALLGPDGEPQAVDTGDGERHGTETVLQLTQASQRFEFHNVAPGTVPSVLRGFSAPVVLDIDLGFDELAFLLANDNDPFNRWEAGQTLATDVIMELVAKIQTSETGEIPPVPARYVSAWGELLEAGIEDLNFKAEALSLPSVVLLAEKMPVIDPDAIHAARRAVIQALARAHHGSLVRTWRHLKSTGPFSPDAVAAGKRALANVCLGTLASLDNEEVLDLANEQLENATNMTDELAALTCIAHSSSPLRMQAAEAFHDRWKNEALVVDKWLRTIATSSADDTLDQVIALTDHPSYNAHNPNKVYSLIGAFTVGNPVRFHAQDGRGYAFLTDTIMELDSRNPQVAARMMSALTQWQRYDSHRQGMMRSALEKILAKPGLSPDVFEIVSKSLGAGDDV